MQIQINDDRMSESIGAEAMHLLCDFSQMFNGNELRLNATLANYVLRANRCLRSVARVCGYRIFPPEDRNALNQFLCVDWFDQADQITEEESDSE